MNQPNWVDVALWVISSFGFVLAVILAVAEIRRYHLDLHLKIQCYKVEYFGNQESVVLFRLIFVNPASAGKTVSELKYSEAIWIRNAEYIKRLGISWRAPEAVHDINQGTVIFSLPNRNCVMLYNEMLECPLDIPPNQSRIRWYYLIAKLGEASLESSSFEFRVEAYDIFQKKLACDSRVISVENLKQIGLHD